MASYNYLSFQNKVKGALQDVQRALELERKPRLAEDVDHTYGAKYGLVNLTTNAAIIAFMNCFKKFGLDGDVLKSIDKTKPATLQFELSTSSKFLKEVKVDVPVNRSYEESEVTTESDPSNTTTKKKVLKAVNHITEFHWEVEINWSVFVYSGTSKEDGKIIKSRKCITQLITQSKQGISPLKISPRGLPINWLLQQIDTNGLTSQFKVDVENDATKTPRRNDDVDNAMIFTGQVRNWCNVVERQFLKQLQILMQKHNPAIPKPQTFTVRDLPKPSVFNPILPLMEEEKEPTNESDDIEIKSIIAFQRSNGNGNDDTSTLLSSRDMSSLLNEHVRALDEQVNEIEKSWPSNSSDNIVSSAEATLSFLIGHLRHLSTQFDESMAYIESMMENQLIAAIGKRLEPKDLDKFVKYHNARLLQPIPQPFSHAIRRPEHYPVGLLSIESQDGETECIHSHSREVNPSSNLKIPLSAATVLELTGHQYLHGYMNHRFGSSRKSHQLVARARQFSSFILVIGTMTDGSTLDPKDAIIVQNKDELLIPLLLEELPTAKEFKDAIKSLSPEQQRFARAYRKMQLASSVFGICVIQIKPQLERLLGLPPDSLDKEMKLTQDLMELFIEYQVPSDLLSYNGFSDNVSTEDKISNVRNNVKSVMDVVEAEKEKQLKAEQAKTEMAMEKTFQRAGNDQFEARLRRKAMGAPPQQQQHARPPQQAFMAMASPPPQTSSSRMSMHAPVGRTLHAEAFSMEMMADNAMLESEQASVHGNGITPTTNLLKSYVNDAPVGRTLHAEAFSMEMMADDAMLECEEDHYDPSPPVSSKKVSDEVQNRQSSSEIGESQVTSDQGVDFTLIPQILDSAVEKSGDGNAIRSTTIKTGDHWVRNRQDNLLTTPKRQRLNVEEVKKEKNKAFDLLDALSRSGSLSIEYSELHVVVAVTHCFDKSVMSTVVQDNINPIEKLERSTLLLASAMHGVPARELIRDNAELQRLEGAMPLLMGVPENS
eukprot:CAMPEP_0183784576 /NCGR_PEP_ID=MMETSP0739-20130205/66049_1 /TAXON_ID=385413 /ORGANISM="Thalassiosira miniscula, Strain CCMP1093" /LENGTH=996 /DNA_ID=CAMNT_0026028547 /DNA_START=118 /DNA_END=3109 /DNA_ORIENTATION=+